MVVSYTEVPPSSCHDVNWELLPLMLAPTVPPPPTSIYGCKHWKSEFQRLQSFCLEMLKMLQNRIVITVQQCEYNHEQQTIHLKWLKMAICCVRYTSTIKIFFKKRERENTGPG